MWIRKKDGICIKNAYVDAVEKKNYRLVWSLLHTFEEILNHDTQAQISEILKYKIEELLPVQREFMTRMTNRIVSRYKGKNVIGRVVTVTVDRPLGSYHPKHKELYYPVNYGFVEGIMAADGEEQDAYILGIDEAVEKFAGKIIAVVHRKNDVEEKWVVAPEGVTLTKEEVSRQIQFQEQYFESEIVM